MLLVILIMKKIFCVSCSELIHKFQNFGNNSSANIKLLKTQLYKTGQSGGFLGRLFGLLLKTGLLLIGNVPKPLVKSILVPLGLTKQINNTRSYSKENLWIRNYSINNFE